MIKVYEKLLNNIIMKKLKNLGKALSKAEQKEIKGGAFSPSLCSEGTLNLCESDDDCCGSETCELGTHIEPGRNEFDVHQVGGGPNWSTEQRCR